MQGLLSQSVVNRILGISGLVMACAIGADVYAETGWIVHTKPIVSTSAHVIPMSANPADVQRQGRQVIQSLGSRTGQPISWTQSLTTNTYVVKGVTAAGMSKIKSDPEVEWIEPDTRRYAINRLKNYQPTAYEPQSSASSVQPFALTGIIDPYNSNDTLWNLDLVDAGGAHFGSAWGRAVTGQGQVIAVIDSGGTDHSDLGILSSATGAWISKGYTFISDCRSSGVCDFSTPQASAQRAPVADARDLGDGVTSAELLSADTDLRPTGAADDCVATNSSWHGTFLAGVIAAQKNTIGGVGAAYNARILPVRVLGKCGGLTSDIVTGIRWAAGLTITGVTTNPHPAKILVLSLGSPRDCSRAEQEAIDDVVKAGAVVLVAAGNESVNLDTAPVTPAVCKNVTTITGHDRQGLHADYANYGNAVFMSAPAGRNETIDPAAPAVGMILGTSNDGVTTLGTETYLLGEGTSFAAPHVAAAVALMREKYADLTPSEVRWALRQSARPFLSDMCSAVAHRCGAGLLDADQAIVWAGQAVAARGTSAAVPNDFVATDWPSTTTSKGGCTMGQGSDHGIVISLLLACIAMMRSLFRRKRLTLGQ